MQSCSRAVVQFLKAYSLQPSAFSLQPSAFSLQPFAFSSQPININFQLIFYLCAK
jgi:hypothetical protein